MAGPVAPGLSVHHQPGPRSHERFAGLMGSERDGDDADPEPELWQRANPAIKLLGGPQTNDARRYVKCCADYHYLVSEPFDGYMGGSTCKLFWNEYPPFTNTNDLSLTVLIKMVHFQTPCSLYGRDLATPSMYGDLYR